MHWLNLLIGAVYGTYEAVRYKVPGLMKIRYIGQTTLGSAAIFGLFLGAGSLIHCGKSNQTSKCNEYLTKKMKTKSESFSTIERSIMMLLSIKVFGIGIAVANKYLKVSEITVVECVDWLCACVYEVFDKKYLRKPTPRDIERLYLIYEEMHGFSGMLLYACGFWEKCQNVWCGQFTRCDIGKPTIILKVVAS
uniref:Uncharacterized protein n=1 Tax=Lactuca sativa TaxID=4236 RepID=A0A9R1WD17_LACSA|nr:hypothetical protein LSAT_V11C200062290 [Lactuca sativa]